MAQKVITQLVDDLDGKELKDGDGQTIKFAIGRSQYEIDLSDKNVGKFYDALKPYTDAARKVGASRASSSPRAAASSSKEDLQAIREWARGNGHEVSERGRISQAVRDAYESAH